MLDVVEITKLVRRLVAADGFVEPMQGHPTGVRRADGVPGGPVVYIRSHTKHTYYIQHEYLCETTKF